MCLTALAPRPPGTMFPAGVSFFNSGICDLPSLRARLYKAAMLS